MKSLKQIVGKRNLKEGMSFESKVYARLKKQKPLFIIHSNGSRGLFDIVLQMKSGQLRCIVVRTNGYLTPKERNAIHDYISRSPNSKVELHYKKSERKAARFILEI